MSRSRCSFLFNAEPSERDFFNLSAHDQSHARSEVLPVEFYTLKGSEGRRAKFGYRLFMRYHPLTILEPLARSLLSPPSMNHDNLKQITRDKRIGIYEWICFDADRLNRFLLDTGTLLPDAVSLITAYEHWVLEARSKTRIWATATFFKPHALSSVLPEDDRLSTVRPFSGRLNFSRVGK